MLGLQISQLDNIVTTLTSLLLAQLASHKDAGLDAVREELTRVQGELMQVQGERTEFIKTRLAEVFGMAATEREQRKAAQDEQLADIEKAIQEEMNKPPVGFKPGS